MSAQGGLASAVMSFCFASVTMILGNKLAVTAVPLPCTLVIIQAAGTLLLLQLPYCKRQTAPFSTATAVAWLPIAALFTTMLFTSLQSFVYAGVSTILIFRNIGAIVTTIVEYFVRGEAVNARVVASEICIVAGAVLYGNGAFDFSWTGAFWIFFNIGAQVAYGVLLKSRMESSPQLAGLSKFSMSRYNNLLAIPMVAAVLVVRGEAASVAPTLSSVTPTGWAYVALTCFFGFLISTSGFELQRLVSATTFIVINNLTKFFNILLGIFVLGDRVEGPATVGGCLLALLAGCWYSYEMSALQAAKKAKRG